jgi:site-specific DNA recombinase
VADPGRNPHRTGQAWTLGTAASILSNPRYTGHQVWNRQRTDHDLVDPADTCLGYRQVQRWNLPDGWVISRRPAHPALVSEADFITAQAVNAARGPAPREDPIAPQQRRYLLAGLLACGICERRMESAWSNGKPVYRCRHVHTSASAPDPGRVRNAYIREDRILPQLPAVHALITGTAPGRRRRTRAGADIKPRASAEDVLAYLREHRITLTYDPAAGTLSTGSGEIAQTITLKAS